MARGAARTGRVSCGQQLSTRSWPTQAQLADSHCLLLQLLQGHPCKQLAPYQQPRPAAACSRLLLPSLLPLLIGNSVLKLLSEDPSNYPDAPREGIRRVLEEVTGVPHPR